MVFVFDPVPGSKRRIYIRHSIVNWSNGSADTTRHLQNGKQQQSRVERIVIDANCPVVSWSSSMSSSSPDFSPWHANENPSSSRPKTTKNFVIMACILSELGGVRFMVLHWISTARTKRSKTALRSLSGILFDFDVIWREKQYFNYSSTHNENVKQNEFFLIFRAFTAYVRDPTLPACGRTRHTVPDPF